MPLYDYACSPCDAEFEVSRPMSISDLPADCPSCGRAAKRLISMPLFVFVKGSAIDERDAASAANKARWSHNGHTHGPDAAAHSH